MLFNLKREVDYYSMDKSVIILIAVSLGLLLLLAIHHYIFSIYEVTFEQSSSKLFADDQSTFIINAIPVNALGMRAPFRKSNTKYEIREGIELVDVLINDYESGRLKLRARSKTGKVIIYAKSEYSLLPTSFEIIIEPNFAMRVN